MFPIIFGGINRRSALPPSPPAGAVFATVAHPSLCTTDTAGGTPCGNGDAIRWWRDIVSGTWYEQATSGARLILRADGTKWYAEGGAGRFHAWVAGVARRDLTFAVGLRHSTSGVTHQMVISDGSGFRELRTGASGGSLNQYQATLNNGAGVLTLGTTCAAIDYRVIASNDGGGTTVGYTNGAADGSAADGTTAGTVNLQIGGRSTNFSFLGRVYALAGYTSALDAAAVAAADSWLLGYMP